MGFLFYSPGFSYAVLPGADCCSFGTVCRPFSSFPTVHRTLGIALAATYAVLPGADCCSSGTVCRPFSSFPTVHRTLGIALAATG